MAYWLLIKGSPHTPEMAEALDVPFSKNYALDFQVADDARTPLAFSTQTLVYINEPAQREGPEASYAPALRNAQALQCVSPVFSALRRLMPFSRLISPFVVTTIFARRRSRPFPFLNLTTFASGKSRR